MDAMVSLGERETVRVSGLKVFMVIKRLAARVS